MEFITGKYISRRTMLRGMGTAIGLPLLDAMVPANKLWAATEAGKAADGTRLVCRAGTRRRGMQRLGCHPKPVVS